MKAARFGDAYRGGTGARETGASNQSFTRSVPLVVVLAVQAFLLLFALDLLPIWTDELFTLNTVAHPAREIISIVQQDIHPPFYYLLLHYWQKLPLPWTGVALLRAFSAVWALLATWLLDLFWTRHLKVPQRWLALSLFAFSPCLLLYGRMARSYAMQTALALLALSLLWRWIRSPRSTLLACCAAGAVLALLYTHYVPGMAVLAGFVLVGWRCLGTVRIGVLLSAVALGYLPWLITLMDAVRRWGQATSFSASYALSGNAILEHILKIGFGVVSLTIGESFLGLSLLLVPVVLLLAASGVRSPEFPRRFQLLVAIAGVIGYLGVSRWVSYPFIPARLLWLLPFLCLAVAAGIFLVDRVPLRIAAVVLIGLSYVSSIVLCFRRENFLNLGYNAPLPEIAATLNQDAQPGDLILMDAYNTDYQVLAAQLSGRVPRVILDSNGVSEARGHFHSAATVWIVRNTRDISPGRTTTAIQNEACTGRQERDTLLEPYADWQVAAMRVAGLQPLVTHFYQLTRCR